jgi:ribosomal protein S6--L-glutamate ligase
VILADTSSVAAAIIEALQSTRQNVLIQKFVAESKGRDVRALVVGDRVVAAMRRRAEGQEFRSNIHRGGKAERIDLDDIYERTAVRAAQIMGLRVAGVDMLESSDGPQVMEVNSSPGLEGIETTTGVDVAGAVVDLVQDQVLFPDIDIRQRLSTRGGYGVAEFTVTPESELVDCDIKDAGLGDREVTILSINRGGLVIPSPRGDQRLLPGDRLLCFGKLLTLKTFVREDTRPDDEEDER